MLRYYKSHFLVFQTFRAFVSLVLLILLTMPTKMYRKTGTRFNKSAPFVHVDYSQNFCRMPIINRTLPENETLTELKLPANSSMTEELRQYAVCRIERKTLLVQESPELCLCHLNYGYAILCIVSASSILICVVQCIICFRADPWKPGFGYFLFAVLGCFAWLATSACSVANHYNDNKKVKVYSGTYDDYFRKPFTTHMSVGFCFFSFMLSLIESIYMATVFINYEGQSGIDQLMPHNIDIKSKKSVSEKTMKPDFDMVKKLRMLAEENEKKIQEDNLN